MAKVHILSRENGVVCKMFKWQYVKNVGKKKIRRRTMVKISEKKRQKMFPKAEFERCQEALRKAVHIRGCTDWEACPKAHIKCSAQLNVATGILWSLADLTSDVIYDIIDFRRVEDMGIYLFEDLQALLYSTRIARMAFGMHRQEHWKEFCLVSNLLEHCRQAMRVANLHRVNEHPLNDDEE